MNHASDSRVYFKENQRLVYYGMTVMAKLKPNAQSLRNPGRSIDEEIERRGRVSRLVREAQTRGAACSLAASFAAFSLLAGSTENCAARPNVSRPTRSILRMFTYA
jgi:hypothetical protein